MGFILYLIQISNRVVIGQEILCFDAMGRISKLLDQIILGLRPLGVLSVVHAFPEMCAPLFTYTACVSASSVNDAIYVDTSITTILPGDQVVLEHLRHWVNEASEKCK